MIDHLDKWHKTKLGLAVFAVIELGLAYGFAGLAIDRGNFFYYLLALIFLVGTLQNFIKLIGKIVNVKQKSPRK